MGIAAKAVSHDLVRHLIELVAPFMLKSEHLEANDVVNPIRYPTGVGNDGYLSVEISDIGRKKLSRRNRSAFVRLIVGTIGLL